MQGLMQDWPLLCHRIIDHAAIQHADRAGRLALGRRADPHDELRRDPQARAEGGAAARERRHQARRPRRHAGLEHLAASRSLVRHPRHRRDLPHRQSAAVPRPDLLDRQSCRGPHDVRRSDVPADPGKARRRADDHRALRRADRRRAHAGDHAEERRRLRGMDRRGRRRFRLEELRREHRGRHVLHLGHHRQSQGRALLAPLQRAALDDGGAAGRHGRRRRATWCCRWCRCSTPIAGRSRSPSPHDRRVAGDAGRQARRRLDLRAARHLQGDVHRGGADGLADAAAAPGEDRPQAAASQARRDRRLGLPARHDAGVPGQLRRRGHPRLGHDRDEPARLALHAEAGICRADRRGQARRADEAGPSAVRRRDEDHRRQRQGAAVGRQDLRPPQGARARGRAALLQGRQRTSSTTRASSTPATSPPWTRTATCRSPTAPRT